MLLGDLRLEQGANDLVDAVLALDAGGDDLVIGRPHAGELQGRHHLQDLRAIHGPPPSRPHRRRGDWAVVATHRSERNRREAEPAAAIAPVWQWCDAGAGSLRRARMFRITSALYVPESSASAQARLYSAQPIDSHRR